MNSSSDFKYVGLLLKVLQFYIFRDNFEVAEGTLLSLDVECCPYDMYCRNYIIPKTAEAYGTARTNEPGIRMKVRYHICRCSDNFISNYLWDTSFIFP